MLGEILALLAAFSFGCANVMVKKGSTSISDNGAFLSLLITFSLAGIITLVNGLLRSWAHLTANGIWWFILAGVLTAFLGRSLLFTSIQHLGSVRASAIKRLNPLFTVLIGVLFLHEPLNSVIITGMIFVFASSAVLMIESMTLYKNANKEVAATTQPNEKTTLENEHESRRNLWVRWIQLIASFGYIYGVVSALAYSIGYVVRKEGLNEIPDPFFGTTVGAFIGVLIFLIFSLFKQRYRESIRSTFSSFQPWLFGAGTATSLGQILYFSALTVSGVSQVSVIASTDVIITLLLSSLVFKTHEAITKTVIFASVIAMIGAGLIAVG
ncbi:DMT family transporter [Bacillus canaveralius]|uniref:DMT family transporter n=1 Tax=Bacillus canaveralius TaxID=1403243 RepID=UPI000F773A4C|nr:DMT family transporter [Bacillus canaveralius]RSK53760.1 EamA family transporter [Bacillus canaveralius]